ncbi:MAG: SAM-dependent methyltransferase [Moraxellaceae bacterium]|jgi:release factor glutamine methyltransferase|nr:SAM-dependent methyltransferase [Moraxellaceae bacterium]
MTTVGEALAEAGRRLADVSPSARIDADCLLQHVLERDRAWLRAYADAALGEQEQRDFEAALQRRLAGDPVAYITGARGFWSLDLLVNGATLIPRPETELMVEWALELLAPQAAMQVLDLGTGSGAIALAVKKERPGCQVVAVDASAGALKVARANAHALALDVELLESNWFSALLGRRFDLLLSNPPYIAVDDPHLAQGDLRFEPLSALAAGEDGLADLRRIVAAAPGHLVAGGWLLLEHGYAQGSAVRALLAEQAFIAIETRRDLAGQDRITGGRLPC